MKLRITKSGDTTVDVTDHETRESLRQAAQADDKWEICDITDLWRDDFGKDHLVLTDDDGTLLWEGDFG